jgi:beta-galactosidase
LIDPSKGTIRIKNKYQFISLDGFAGEWNVTENGVKIAEGKFDVPHIEAFNESIVNLPVKVENPKAGAEYFLNVSYTQKGNTLWADRGFEVAAEQFKLPINTPAMNGSKPAVPVKIKKDGNLVKISGNGFSLVFDQKTGFMTQLNKSEKNLLVEGESPKLVLWRAAHRNDDMWTYDNWSKYGLNSLTFSPVDFKVTKVDKSSVRLFRN